MSSEIEPRAWLRRPTAWPAWIERLVSMAVIPGERVEVTQMKRLFTATMWVSLITSAVSISQYAGFGAPLAAWAVSIPIYSAVIALFAMWRRPSSYPAIMHVVAAGTISASTGLILVFGGVFKAAGGSVWSVLAVVGAVAIFADRRALLWAGVFTVTTIAASLAASRIGPVYELPQPEYFALFNLLAAGGFIYAILYYFVRQSERLYRQSEELLRNILPDEIADRLKASNSMIADHIDSASILFADVAGFTPLAAQLEPEDMIELLNEIFTAFDALVDASGLEKIKTIGDAYMVSAGVPVPRDDHARAICDLAIDMQSRLDRGDFAGRSIAMRIGIASGPVVAGIIGRRKFSYDLWGDTVNLASRMESNGTPGRIQVPEATRDLAAQWFEFEERGTIEVKGKGELATWYLVGRIGD